MNILYGIVVFKGHNQIWYQIEDAGRWRCFLNSPKKAYPSFFDMFSAYNENFYPDYFGILSVFNSHIADS